MMENKIPWLSYSILLLSFLPTTAESRGGVERLGSPTEVTDSNGVVYDEIYIICNSKKDRRYALRKSGDTKWCYTLDGKGCSSNKLAVAKKACRADESEILTASLITSAQAEQPVDELETAEPQPVSNTSTQAPASGAEVEPEQPEVVAEPERSTAPEDELDQERRLIEMAQEELRLKREELERKKRQLLTETP